MNTGLFAQTAQAELEAWENFKNRYKAQVPPPAKASLTIWQTIGWQLVLIMLQAFGAIGLAALRTAEMFYLASAGASVGVRRAEAVLAIMAVEFGIVVFAAIRTEAQNNKLSDEEKLQSLNVSTGWLVAGEVVMLTISVVAGLGLSFKGFDVDINFDLILAVVIGAGASVVAAVAGMVIGAMLARWNNVRTAAESTYRKEYGEWEQSLRDSWNSSPDKLIVENQLKLAKKYLPKELVRSLPVHERFVNANENEQSDRAQQATEKRTLIWQYLVENSTEEFIPGPSEVARALEISKGAFVSDVIKEFREQHFSEVVQ